MTATTSASAGWAELAGRLSSTLHLSAPPIFLAFGPTRPEGVPAFEGPMSAPAADGRRGRVPASCVFWMEAAQRGPFSTVSEDHGNCSVGRFTHGFAELDAGNDDVKALLESGWVTPEMVPGIPSVTSAPGSITYGPLGEVPAGTEPDVVLLRVNGRQMMVLSDSIPDLSIEGKPQCHIVALAKEHGRPAASVGCALSRARTGMRAEEMTCALPAGRLAGLVEAIEQTATTDSVVARYAAEDARRFGV
ncbi:MAG TPA: DUF169 domain-containing protein [Acidimicrobiales bacterium]|nr:DUF169 domain-containing protein [Acidimicrobiales bacterium]